VETYANAFPPSLISMDGVEAGAATCDHAQLINGGLATGQRSGYVFTYVPTPPEFDSPSDEARARGCMTPGAAAYEVHADPITRGTTGRRSFYTDQTGVIRFAEDGPASADSPPLE
jgi:hypothetical protein